MKEALGHADFSSTMICTLVTDEDEAKAIAQLSWEPKARAGYLRQGYALADRGAKTVS